MATMAAMFVKAPYLNIDCPSVLSLMFYGKVNNLPKTWRITSGLIFAKM